MMPVIAMQSRRKAANMRAQSRCLGPPKRRRRQPSLEPAPLCVCSLPLHVCRRAALPLWAALPPWLRHRGGDGSPRRVATAAQAGWLRVRL
jgi:hypothetical protein